MAELNNEKDFIKYIIKKYNDNKRINHILSHVSDEIIEPTESPIIGSVNKYPTRSMPNPIYSYELEPTPYGYLLFPISRPILHPTKLKSSIYNIVNEIHSKIHIKKPKTFQDLNFQDDPCPDCYTLLFSAEMAEGAPTDDESLEQIKYDLQSSITEILTPLCIVGNTPVLTICRIFTVNKRYTYQIAWVNNQKSLEYIARLVDSVDTAKSLIEKIEEIETTYINERANRDKVKKDYDNALTTDRAWKIKEVKEAERRLKIVIMDCCDKVESLLGDTNWSNVLDFFGILISGKKSTSLSHIFGDGEDLCYINKAQLSRLRSGEQKPNYVNAIKFIFKLKVGIITALVWLKKARYTFSDNKIDKRLWYLIEYKQYDKFNCNDEQEMGK